MKLQDNFGVTADAARAFVPSASSPTVSPVPASIPNEVWLIWATEGEYSDRREWPVAAMLNKAEAEAAVLRLKYLWRAAVTKYKAREDELDEAQDWQGNAIWEQEPEARELEAITGHRDSLSMCDPDDREYTCCLVPIWTAQGTEAGTAETGTGSVHDGPVVEDHAPNVTPPQDESAVPAGEASTSPDAPARAPRPPE